MPTAAVRTLVAVATGFVVAPAFAGDPIGFYGFAANAAVGVSDSGHVLLTNGQIWTASGGFQPALGGGVRISADGRFTISEIGNQAFRYNVSTGQSQVIASPTGGSFMRPTSVSADGGAIAGWDNNVGAWRWTPSTGAVAINVPGTGLAYDVSRDGQRVAGWSPTGPFIHDQSTGLQMVPGTGAEITAFNRFSGDGSLILGGEFTNGPTGRFGQAFTWTAQGGYTFLGQIGPIPGNDQQYTALASNWDGSLIGGSQASRRAWIWDAANGMRDLKQMLTTEFGFNLTNWELRSVSDISADGRYIVGVADYNTNGVLESRGWVAIIPTPGSTLLVASAVFTGVRRPRRTRS